VAIAAEARSVTATGRSDPEKSVGGHRASPQIYRAKRTPVLRHITGDYGPLMTQPETALSHSSWTI
jgi:hypothetical protein